MSVKTTIVSSKELGTNCWLVRRFIEGKRCEQVMKCQYPEKKTCKAVDTEIAYLREQYLKDTKTYHVKISKLL